MSEPDISIALALHHEAPYVARTWASLAEAARFARASGISTEIVVVLDRADPATVAALGDCNNSAFSTTRVISADNGSLGLTRNDGIAACSGRYILTADGDDLISYNFIQSMYIRAELLGPQAILIPKFVFAFGASYYIAEYFGLEDVTGLVLLIDHPFISRIFFHRSLSERLNYQDVNVERGSYAYEDWHFNCEAITHGYTFDVVPETILFYRQRGGNLLDHSNRSSIKQIPPTRLFQPSHFRRICGPAADRLRVEGDFRRQIPATGMAILANPVTLDLVAAANVIDPAIEPQRLLRSSYLNYLDINLAPALAYDRICESIGDRQFDEVFLLPFLTTGGADRYMLDIMREFAAINPRIRILVIFGQPFDRYAWLDELPAGTVHIDLLQSVPEIEACHRDLICLKLLQACAPAGRIHLKSSEFTHRFFSRFAPALAHHRPVFYRFSDGMNTYGDIALIEPSGFHFVSEHIEFLDMLVCDNAGIIEADQRRIQMTPEKWRLLPSRIEFPETFLVDIQEPQASPMSILWVSRIDHEKRPTLLMEIARLLYERRPDTTIEVYGRATLGSFDVTRFKEFPNIRYQGKFKETADMQPGRHGCFIYTSSFDGMPVVLLEMVAAGLPLVAPDVGAIPELVHDRDTGLLISCSGDDVEDAVRYVCAIESLLSNRALRQKLSRRAWDLVADRHAPWRYRENVAAIFDPLHHGTAILDCVAIPGFQSAS